MRHARSRVFQFLGGSTCERCNFCAITFCTCNVVSSWRFDNDLCFVKHSELICGACGKRSTCITNETLEIDLMDSVI